MAAQMTPRFRDLPDVDWSSFADGEVPTYGSGTDTLTGETPAAGGATGAVAGVLSGSLPNPEFAVDMATQAELDSHSDDPSFVHGITNTADLATDAEVAAAVAAHAADATAIHGILDANGYVYTQKVTEPADVDIPNSTVVWWIDSLGSTLFKGKDAAGVVYQLSLDDMYWLRDWLTTKGDLFVGQPSGAETTPSTLSAGTDGQVLTADSAQAKGLKWATPGAGYTDEQAQDAVGTILTDTATVDFTYSDATPSVTAAVKTASIDESHLTSGASIPQAKVATLVADLAAKQPLDSDLTALAALTTTSFGRGLLELANQGALLSAAGAASSTDSRFPAGADIVNADIDAAAAIAKSKLASLDVVNADVNASAAIAESKLNLASDAAAGTASRRTLGTSATSAAAGNDSRLSDTRAPTSHATAHADGGTDELVTALDARTFPTSLMLDRAYVTGQYYPAAITPHGGLGGQGAPTQSRVYYTLFIVTTTTTFDRIACYITTNGTATSVMRLGIYNDNAGVPGTVLLDAGTVAIDAGAASIKAITISQQLTPGRYWAASVVQTAASGNVQRTIPMSWGIYLTSTFASAAWITEPITGAFGNNPTMSPAAVNPTMVALRALSSP